MEFIYFHKAKGAVSREIAKKAKNRNQVCA